MEKIYYTLDKNTEYYNIIKEILNHEEFQKRKTFMHHEDRTVFEHSIMVSIRAYKIARFLHLDTRSIAIGALLHDFYTTPWQEKKTKEKLFHQHGFIHAKVALENAKKYFAEYMNDKIEDIIVRHMFPLNPTPPKYIESWIVTLVDKYVSLEIIKKPSRWYRYVGFMEKGK